MNKELDTNSWFFRNAANMITLLGFPLCSVLLWVVCTHREWTWTILALVTAVLLTDFFDGIVARYLKVVSKFGAAADRLRDKLLLGVVFLFLILDGRIHITLKIITIPMAVVETSLLVLWFMGVRKNIDVSAGQFGKIKMFLMSIAILLLCLNLIIEERWGQGYHIWATTLLNLMFLVSLIFAVKSFIVHRIKYRKQLKSQNPCQ